MHWNAVPWFTGDERRNKSANRSSVIQGVPWLVRVIRLWAYFDAFEGASADMLAWC